MLRSSTRLRKSPADPEPCCSSGPRSRQRLRRRCRPPVCSRRLCARCGRATFARRAGPAVVHHVRPERRIRVLPLEVRRGHEELEALGVGRRHSVPLIHVPAADPLRSRCDADLVHAGIAVVTRGRAGRVGSVRVVVAGRLRVRPADSAAGVNRVPPVVVVVRVRAVPASVVRPEGVVRPADSGVLVCDHDPGAVEARAPRPVGALTWLIPGSITLGRPALGP